MAEKRMFSNKITASDAFSDMSLAAQALYFQLGMSADDDGIVDRPNRIRKAIGAPDEAFAELVEKRFVLVVDGVTIIKHWHMNNNIRDDKKAKTAYPEIVGKLNIKENGAYTLADKGRPYDSQAADACRTTDRQTAANGQPIGGTLADNVQDIGGKKAVQNSIEENSNNIYTHTGRARACAYIEETEKEPEKGPEQPSAMELFEQFWKVYPYKVARIAAEQAWARLNPTPELAAEIIAGVNKHREKNESWRRDKGRYIPKPETFIADQRWRDELPEELPQSDKPITKPKPKPGSFGDFPQREYTEDSFAELERRKYAELMARGGGG